MGRFLQAGNARFYFLFFYFFSGGVIFFVWIPLGRGLGSRDREPHRSVAAVPLCGIDAACSAVGAA